MHAAVQSPLALGTVHPTTNTNLYARWSLIIDAHAPTHGRCTQSRGISMSPTRVWNHVSEISLRNNFRNPFNSRSPEKWHYVRISDSTTLYSGAVSVNVCAAVHAGNGGIRSVYLLKSILYLLKIIPLTGAPGNICNGSGTTSMLETRKDHVQTVLCLNQISSFFWTRKAN